MRLHTSEGRWKEWRPGTGCAVVVVGGGVWERGISGEGKEGNKEIITSQTGSQNLISGWICFGFFFFFTLETRSILTIRFAATEKLNQIIIYLFSFIWKIFEIFLKFSPEFATIRIATMVARKVSFWWEPNDGLWVSLPELHPIGTQNFLSPVLLPIAFIFFFFWNFPSSFSRNQQTNESGSLVYKAFEIDLIILNKFNSMNLQQRVVLFGS